MTKQLNLLKQLGHELLDEYIALDTYRGEQAERRHAYSKLSTKLKTHYNAHFSMMNTPEEVKEAITKLRKMIKKRRHKIKVLGYDKRVFAPNLQELQCNIKFEKVG